MKEEIEGPPTVRDLLENPLDLVVVLNVQIVEPNLTKLGRGLLDPIPHRLALMGEGQLHPGSLQRSRTRPGDGVLVGHADHEAFLSIQQTGYRAGLTHDFIRFGLVSDLFAISYQLSAIGNQLS
jgi:hypothetical protein